MKIVQAADIRRAVGPGGAVRAVREAFRADGLGRTTVPAVINLPMPSAEGEIHVKSAAIDGVPYVAVKVASGFPRNPERGLPAGSGLMLVLDAATGLPVALLLDEGYLTDLRTGAAGAVAAEALARRGIAAVGVLGTGVQARHQIACLREVRSVERLLAWSPSRERREAFCAEMRDTHGLDAVPCDGPEAVAQNVDLLVTVTYARAPLVRAEWLRPGVHVTAAGADAPGKQELDPGCLRRADVVAADRVAQCAAFGELSHAPDVRAHAELGQIVAGLRPGRTRDDQITIADLTGVGFQDTAIANAVLQAIE